MSIDDPKKKESRWRLSKLKVIGMLGALALALVANIISDVTDNFKVKEIG